jgi:hypothetical protein
MALTLCLSAAVAHAQALLPTTPRLAPPRPGGFLSAAIPPVASAPAGPGQQCRAAIRAAERAAGIPHQLMAAIGRVESGRREADGSVNPWPWSINAEGVDHVFESKAEAVAAVRALQAKGMRSIDVGCMQVNLLHHPDAFPTLEQAFDPGANAAYAARFLVQLKEQTGTWPTATAWYHSATPDLGADYERRVMAVLPEERKQPDEAPRPALGSTSAGGFTRSYAGGFVPPTTAPRTGPGAARVIPLPAGASGRGLAAYRAAPVQLALRAAPVVAPRPPSNPG